MIGKTISHYRIIEKLGEGGMGVVYRAHDTKLDRDVALKFLPHHLSPSEDDKKRFMHEARSASSLDHSNICTIYLIDETPDGQLFIVMPDYDGIPLNKKIVQGPLPVNEAIDIAIQIADGLQIAHEKGIIHRDIKSSNIFITEKGQVKIMDFGLARSAAMTQMTKTGITVGTVPYMSPEQARGEKVDHRTDIWSSGVIIYEMVTGQMPFRSDYKEAVIYAIIHEEPLPVTGLRSGIPLELERIITKTLAKNPAERYQHVDELATDLRRLQKLSAEESGASTSAMIKTRRKRLLVSPLLWGLVTLFLVLVIGLVLFYPNQSIPFSERDWILITDFDNQTGDSLFDHALNTALVVSIQQSKYVNVFPQSRIQKTLQRMQLEKPEKLNEELGREIAQREGIKLVLVPVISQIGNRYSLSATLIDPNSQNTIAIAVSEVKEKDQILKALDGLAKKIRQNLGESLFSISTQYTMLPQATTSSLEALRLYAEAWRLQGRDDNATIELLRRAVNLDPDFALAHAFLGLKHYLRGENQKGEEHFQKALNLMERLTLREQLWIRAVVDDWRGNRDGAIEQYKTYLTQFPDDDYGWYRLGYTYLITGRFNSAIDAFNKVIAINPFEAGAYINIASCYNSLVQDELALDNYLKGLELNPELKTGWFVNHEYGFLLVRMGFIDRAKETFELMLKEDKPKKARGLRSLALLNMYSGKYAAAVVNLKEAILINKSFNFRLSELRDRLFLAAIYSGKKQSLLLDQELGELKSIITEINLGPVWLSQIGKFFVRLERMNDANQLLKFIEDRLGDYLAVTGINQNILTDQASYHVLRGEILLAKGDYNTAIEAIEISANLGGPNFESAFESIAHAYLSKGDLENALQKYQDLLDKKLLGSEEQEHWIRAHYLLGTIYEQKQDVENALKYYNHFLEIWKGGDTDLIDLMDAKKRVAKLKGNKTL